MAVIYKLNTVVFGVAWDISNFDRNPRICLSTRQLHIANQFSWCQMQSEFAQRTSLTITGFP